MQLQRSMLLCKGACQRALCNATPGFVRKLNVGGVSRTPQGSYKPPLLSSPELKQWVVD